MVIPTAVTKPHLSKAWASTLESCLVSFDSTEPYTFLGWSMKLSAQNQLNKIKSTESLSQKRPSQLQIHTVTLHLLTALCLLHYSEQSSFVRAFIKLYSCINFESTLMLQYSTNVTESQQGMTPLNYFWKIPINGCSTAVSFPNCSLSKDKIQILKQLLIHIHRSTRHKNDSKMLPI